MFSIPFIIVLVYVLLLFALSIYMSVKSKKDGENFLLYKGKNNMWITAVTIAGLAIGGASTIGIAENAFTKGLSAGWYDLAWAIGAVVCSLVLVKRLRASGYTTISEMTRNMYGKTTEKIMVVSMIIIQCGIIALQYKAGGSILYSLLPGVFKDVDTATLFSFIIFMLIAFVGGMGSVSVSNIMNITLIYVGVIVATVMVLFNKGGWDATLTMVAENPDVPYLSFWEGMGLTGILGWIVVMCGNTNSVQGVVQIALTSKSDKDAVRGFQIGALMMIPVGFLCALLGVASKALYPDGAASTALPVILMSLPGAIAGLTLAGLWAADMSTACSMLIGLSTTCSRDVFFKTSLGRKLQDKSLIINKIIIAIVGTVTYIVSTQFTSILGAMQKALSLAIGTSFIVLGGLLFPKFAAKRAGFFTILTSIICIVLWNVFPGIGKIFAGQVGFLMLAACGAVFVIVSLVDSRKVGQISLKKE